MEDYAQIAARMATHNDLGIFRRFAELNAQNLLYMQAEIIALECKLRKQEQDNSQSPNMKQTWYSRDWQTLSSAQNIEGRMQTQWQTFLEIREKLKQYNKALAQYAAIMRMDKPRAGALNIMKSNLNDPTTQDFLSGLDRTTWDDPQVLHDLICTSESHEFDPLTSWLLKNFLGIFQKVLGRRYKTTTSPGGGELFQYNESHMALPTEILSTALSSLLPVAAIVNLYFVQNTGRRLAIIAALSVVLSILLLLITNAKRSENFAVTAAFAAVQVVFIGTHGNSTGNARS